MIIERIVVGLAACALSLAANSPLSMAAEESIAALTSPAAGKVLSFTDHTGRAVSERNFAGRFMLVFFGYTSCPDICPTDLQVLGRAVDALGEAGLNVQPVFITIDPERDTPEVLAGFVGHFHPRLVGLTGTTAQIAAAAKTYDVHAETVGRENDSEYFISHTAMTYLVGPDGAGLEMFDHGATAEEIAAGVRKYLKSTRY